MYNIIVIIHFFFISLRFDRARLLRSFLRRHQLCTEWYGVGANVVDEPIVNSKDWGGGKEPQPDNGIFPNLSYNNIE